MAEVAVAGGAGPDVNTAGNPTEMAMAYLQDEKTDGEIQDINLGELDLTTDEFILDEVDIHIQANLEDDLVKEALKTGVDLRQYSKQVESELQRIEQASIKDYIKESQNIALLHNQITACDSILEYPYETLFRSQHYALLDNGCREFLFLSDFFMVTGNSALDLFNSIMGKTLSMFLKSMSTYVSDCYDSIAVFLCIHIILRFRAITVKRTIPALDKYWEAVLELLWPRFELILEMNIHSIRNTDPQKLGVLDTRPHYITRRYAEFSSAIVSINQTFTNEKTHTLLGQLQVEVENFVLKMAAEFPSRRNQLIFLINNYDMMLSVLMERAADDSKEVEGFQQLLLARTQGYKCDYNRFLK
ncbi:vacuolar protein sorting-associated protein 52 homolog [Notothenia coriiceps]|uniref:Vacuolar protein sorting-associated protein 52 homolog n=1 Tax=Notothenia coriiceps TaxID=8208 RepID=A0A6I9P3Z7_9TELE|nr:PREDICTED: vacuolar protein sorting-associated protein 52 homolog [Notothenia coriiceps]